MKSHAFTKSSWKEIVVRPAATFLVAAFLITAVLQRTPRPVVLVLALILLCLLAVSVTLTTKFVQRAKPTVLRHKGHPLLRTMATASRQAFFYCRPIYQEGTLIDLRIRYANPMACEALNLSRQRLRGVSLGAVIDDSAFGEFLSHASSVLTSQRPSESSVPLVPFEKPAELHRLSLMPVAKGLAISALQSRGELAAHHRIEELNQFTQSVFDTAPVSIIVTDATGMVVAMNSAAEQLTLYRRHELIGLHSILVLHDPTEVSARSVELTEQTGKPLRAGFESLQAAYANPAKDQEWTYLRRDGTKAWVNLSFSPLRTPDQRSTGYMAVAFDVTERKRLAETAQHMAHHDHLTGLLNRSSLEQNIERGVRRARRLKDNLAVFLLDIDHFKRINDSLGHSAGDAVLVTIAKRLLETVRSSDTVFRIGGDEFVVILPHLQGQDSADRRAEKILKWISEPFLVDDRELRVTASIGYCLFPNGAERAEELLHKADLAMYAAKNGGRSGYRVFCEELGRETADRLDMEEELRHAIERNQFTPHYQPQVDCETGEVSGMEMLLRWQSPKRGDVSPDVFLPVAAQAGVMSELGEWGIRRACKDCAAAQKALGRRLKVAVNLSSSEFQNPRLPWIVSDALSGSQLAAGDLELEITEQTLMNATPCLMENLAAIRDAGVCLAIDDFGTGFSNFSYILQYSVDRLKIDRSFIRKAVLDTGAASVVTSIITMAHGLGMRVCAEGVETKDHLEFLALRYCDEIQGFLFSRAVPLSELCRVIARIQGDRSAEHHSLHLMSFRARAQHILSTRNCA